ncbi:hypothetical protein AMST5_02517 [freshwater sediment metagenome]|jgi:hypothetical protein|uniref:Uncharacterized protein n=1 Tax=freshwater sediment metagenome TaxID=556182 RepID=A0AA48M039_9ZZZZ
MFHVYLIKIDADPVGVAAQGPDGFRFYAFSQLFGELEQLVFDTADDIRSAALILSGRA